VFSPAGIGSLAVVWAGLVNTNAEARRGSGGLVDCGAVREMEVGWPSGAALRKEAPNHHEGRWLKTVVLSVVEKARP
jgi:hypothetical protein